MAETFVLITGGNQGIGFEIARALAKQEGYRVLIGSRDQPKGAQAAMTLQDEGLWAEAVQVDVTDDDSIERAARDVQEKFGRLDILINNAGIVTEMSLGKDGNNVRKIMQQGYDTNVFGAAQMTETFLPLLFLSQQPRILFVSSSIGSLTRASESPTSTFYPLPMYRTSKAAMNMLTLHYAKTLEAKGVKVNAADPGFCATNMNDYNAAAKSASLGALSAVRLVVENKETGTFYSSNGPVPW